MPKPTLRVIDGGQGPARRPDGVLAAPTFAEAAEAVIAWRESGWTSPQTAREWRRSLATHAYPSIGHLPVSEITRGDVRGVLLPIWDDKRATARRVKERISMICRWAVARGYLDTDPTEGVVRRMSPYRAVQPRPAPALRYDEVAQCLARAKANRRASASAKRALEFLVLTAARVGEVRWAKWDEIDTETAIWRVPPEHAKWRVQRRVPLSGRALEVVSAAPEESNGSGLLFPGAANGRPLDKDALAELLPDLGVDATTVGFRSSFRDYAVEWTDAPVAAIELALGYVHQNSTQAFARSELLRQRRVLMESWARYLAGPP